MAALSRSASASTISGVELPSSSDTFFLWARWRMPQPTCDEPVKVIILTRSSSVSTSPISPERPTITFSQPAGWPASANARASNSAESGVAPAGFSTTAQPAANAGPTLWQTRFSGKLNGEIAPTIPIGRRRIRPALPSPAGCASIGTVSPVSRRASSAEKVIVCTARSTSMPAVAIGLPASWAMVRANSSRRSASSAATPSSTDARLCAGSGFCIARSAASIARVASAPPPNATRPTTLPSYGDVTSFASPVSYHSPSTYSF